MQPLVLRVLRFSTNRLIERLERDASRNSGAVVEHLPRVPPTNVIGAEKAIPSIALQTRRVPMLGATAQGMTKITARRSVVA